jgi:hypothetical protein
MQILKKKENDPALKETEWEKEVETNKNSFGFGSNKFL